MHKSGEWIDGVLLIPAAQVSPQGFGSAMSYARRYALSAIIGVVADDDDDGNAASRPQTSGSASFNAPRQQQTPARPQAPQKPAQQATAGDTNRRELMDRAMALYTTMKENGLKYKGKMFKEMDIPEMRAAIASMEQQLDAIATPAGGIDDEWDDIDAAQSAR
jgi:hypothetical protein